MRKRKLLSKQFLKSAPSAICTNVYVNRFLVFKPSCSDYRVTKHFLKLKAYRHSEWRYAFSLNTGARFCRLGITCADPDRAGSVRTGPAPAHARRARQPRPRRSGGR